MGPTISDLTRGVAPKQAFALIEVQAGGFSALRACHPPANTIANAFLVHYQTSILVDPARLCCGAQIVFRPPCGVSPESDLSRRFHPKFATANQGSKR
jgi:hypothetical protein